MSEPAYEPKVKLTKCPACKNIIGRDTVCCPRCGVNFRAKRRRRILLWLVLLAVAGYFAHDYAVQRGWTKGLPYEVQRLKDRWQSAR